jgi:hypothetical protein
VATVATSHASRTQPDDFKVCDLPRYRLANPKLCNSESLKFKCRETVKSSPWNSSRGGDSIPPSFGTEAKQDGFIVRVSLGSTRVTTDFDQTFQLTDDSVRSFPGQDIEHSDFSRMSGIDCPAWMLRFAEVGPQQSMPVLGWCLNFGHTRERIPSLRFWRLLILVAFTRPPTTMSVSSISFRSRCDGAACGMFRSHRNSRPAQPRRTSIRIWFSREAVS